MPASTCSTSESASGPHQIKAIRNSSRAARSGVPAAPRTSSHACAAQKCGLYEPRVPPNSYRPSQALSGSAGHTQPASTSSPSSAAYADSCSTSSRSSGAIFMRCTQSTTRTVMSMPMRRGQPDRDRVCATSHLHTCTDSGNPAPRLGGTNLSPLALEQRRSPYPQLPGDRDTFSPPQLLVCL